MGYGRYIGYVGALAVAWGGGGHDTGHRVRPACGHRFGVADTGRHIADEHVAPFLVYDRRLPDDPAAVGDGQ
jgi:hypothetical protein